MKLQNNARVGGGRELAPFVLAAALPCLCVFGDAKEWLVSLEDVDGMTPSQQLTNAVTQASSGDTIRFEAGTYRLDGESFMLTATYQNANGTATAKSRAYAFFNSKTLHFAGASSSKWDDATILRGNGNDRFCYATGNAKATFRNLSLENFAAVDDPSVVPKNGNLDTYSLGGAITFGVYDSANIASNCVFRGNSARSGGAVSSIAAIDCMFTNNASLGYCGGAAALSSMLRCRCVDNHAAAGGGAVWWQRGNGLRDCEFALNSTAGYAGAVVGERDGIVSNCVFRGNSADDKSGVVSLRQNGKFFDCVFEGNTAGGVGGVAYSSGADNNGNGGKGTVFRRCSFVNNTSGDAGGAVYEANNAADGPLVFLDCAFTNNYADVSAGAVYGGAFTNCTFFGNSCGKGEDRDELGGAVLMRDTCHGEIVGCSFVSNHFTSVKTWKTRGAAIYAKAGRLVKDCVFYGNYVTNFNMFGGIVVSMNGLADPVRLVDCAFTNNYNSLDGLVRGAFCTNTTFCGNEVPRGGVINRCTAIDCHFIGNRKVDTFWNAHSYSTYFGTPDANVPSGDATSSTLLRCDMDLGCIYDCSLTDCRIHSLTNKGSYCVFYGHNVATNCLVSGCEPPDATRGLIYRWGPITPQHVSGSDYVNCTFADNICSYFLRHQQESGIPTPFKNCVWANNTTTYGTLMDVGYDVSGSAAVDSGVSLSNCVYGAVGGAPGTTSSSRGDTWTDLGGNMVVSAKNLKMAGALAESLGVDKYALRAESPVLGMGDASMFTAADADLAGNLRLRDGRLDPGCFQCWLNLSGTFMLFR